MKGNNQESSIEETNLEHSDKPAVDMYECAVKIGGVECKCRYCNAPEYQAKTVK